MWSGAGLDFGNQQCVIGVPKMHTIEVLLDQSSRRLIPSMVTYTDVRRLAGSFAEHEIVQNIDRTVTQLKRLICLPFDSEERKTVERFVFFKLVPLGDRMSGIQIDSLDRPKVLRPEQLVAYLFKFLLATTKIVQPAVSAFTITVSPCWSQKYRQSIIDSCNIAGIHLIALVNSTTAAAVGYVMDHKKRMPKANEESVPVAFVDLGDSSLNVAIALLKEDSVRIKSFASDEHLGGSNFTMALLEYLSEKVKSVYNIDPRENARIYHRFLSATEKLKKNLSINTSVLFEIAGLKGNTDVRFVVKREEFEEHISHLIPRISQPIEQALQLANISKSDLFAVEVLGGGSRIPAVKSEIARVFGREPETALNLDECFAVGCGYMAAILNPYLKVSVSVVDVTPHEISASWNSKEGMMNLTVFQQFSEVPSTQNLNLELEGSTEITFQSNKEEICKVLIEIPEGKQNVALKVGLTQSSMLEVGEAVKIVEEKEEPIKISVKYTFGLNPSQIFQFQNEEYQLSKLDEYQISIDEARNELETLIFQVDRGINRDFPECFVPEEKDNIISVLSNIRQWYDEHEFERLPLEEYKKRHQELNTISSPAIKRYTFYNLVRDRADELKRRVQSALETIQQLSGGAKEQKQVFIKNAGSFLEYFSTLVDKANELSHHTDPSFSFSEQESIVVSLEAESAAIVDEANKAKSKGWCNVA